MEFEELGIKGLFLIKSNIFKDDRGEFLKVFNKEIFLENNINFEIQESYYSISNKDVIRGMHFQTREFAHDKLVYVANGKVLDVVLDLRKSSKTFKSYETIELSAEEGALLFIPKGCAHGFKSLEDNTMIIYNVSTVYSSTHDCGVRYDSFGMDWGIENPIISDRDKKFKGIEEIELFI